MYKELPGISRPGPTDTLWRYFSFEKFAILLSKKSLYFATANQFEDPFEGHVPLLIDNLYKQHTQRLGEKGSRAVIKLWEEWRKWVMCSCWYHGDHESMAMWERERYSRHNSGIAIKTTMQSLEDSFIHKDEEDVDVYIGKVKYIDYQNLDVPPDILNMNTIYTPFFYKRKAFESEKEVRAIIDASPYIERRFYRVKEGFSLTPEEFDLRTLKRKMRYPKSNEDKGKNLCVCLETLIDGIIVAPGAPCWITKAIKSMVQDYGFDFEVNPSTLLDEPSEVRKH